MRSAAGFQVCTMPLRSLLTMASSDVSTIAARRVAVNASISSVLVGFTRGCKSVTMGLHGCKLDFRDGTWFELPRHGGPSCAGSGRLLPYLLRLEGRRRHKSRADPPIRRS